MADQPKRLELMAEIARLYYHENRKIKEIADAYHISISSVSRLLSEAQEQKIVEVVIHYPFLTAPELGESLARTLGLRAAYVLPDHQGSYADRIERLGRLAARVLEDLLQDGMVLGISLGMAVANTARAFAPTRRLHCPVIRLQGANDNELLEGTDLAQKFAARMGNEFKIFPAPFIVQSREACELILQEPTVRDVIRAGENCDLALIGMGSLDPKVSTLLRNKLLTLENLEELKRAGAVGEVCGKHYDRDGNSMDVEFNRRTVSIELEKLRHIPTVIGVAAGAGKVDAIRGAARGRLINVLVTDAEAARILLEKE